MQVEDDAKTLQEIMNVTVWLKKNSAKTPWTTKESFRLCGGNATKRNKARGLAAKMIQKAKVQGHVEIDPKINIKLKK